jgi:5-methyltetrahydrofolate--homocysteine methyltransferase
LVDSEIKKHYNAFWDRTCHERATLFLSVRTGAEEFPIPKDTDEQWAGIGYKLSEMEWKRRNVSYAADGYPNMWVNLGPGVLSAMLGSGFKFAPDTVWFGEGSELGDLREVGNLALSPDAAMNRLVLDMTRAFCEAANGKFIVGITDIGGVMDVLASFRGTENLLYDLYDNPNDVDYARNVLDALWERAFAESYAILEAANKGAMTAWIPIWCSKRWFPLQCDFSAMISPDSFKRFVLPSIERHAKYLDHSIYHLDGPGELPHLDALLAIPELDGIQWVPGAGNLSAGDPAWFPVYEKIQRARKNIVVTETLTKEQMLFLFENLSQEGLFICSGAESIEEAKEIEIKAKEIHKRKSFNQLK